MSKKMLVIIVVGSLAVITVMAGCMGKDKVTGAGTASGAKNTTSDSVQPVSDSKPVFEERTPEGGGKNSETNGFVTIAESKAEAMSSNDSANNTAAQENIGGRQNTEDTVSTPAKQDPAIIGQEKGAVPVNSAKVLAYYLHGTVKGSCCTQIERDFQTALARNFPGLLQQGKIEFVSIDVDKPENRHYLQDFQVPSRSLVLMLQKNGEIVKSSNLVGVWLKMGDQEKFSQYIKDEVGKFLQEAV